jgi:hypothetical protein
MRSSGNDSSRDDAIRGTRVNVPNRRLDTVHALRIPGHRKPIAIHLRPSWLADRVM